MSGAERPMTDLRALAEKATPGPWTALIDNYGEDTWPGSMFVTADPSESQAPLGRDLTQDDAAYIAASSPDRILKLLDANDTLTARLAAVEGAAAKLSDYMETDWQTWFTDESEATVGFTAAQQARLDVLHDDLRAVLTDPATPP